MIFETQGQGRNGESAKIVEDGDLGSGLFPLWMSITTVNDRSFDLSLSLGLCQCKVHYCKRQEVEQPLWIQESSDEHW